MNGKKAFIYSDRFYDSKYYGGSHPQTIIRIKLTFELIKAYGLLQLPEVILLEPQEATEDEMALIHDRDYIDAFRSVDGGKSNPKAWQYNIGTTGDTPVFPGIFRKSEISTGASLIASRIVQEGGADIAFNIAGGQHYALPNRAAGFCYINDPAIIIKEMVNNGLRVVYLDVDAHHGDGVQWIFYDTDRVLTISLHQDPRFLFPGTGFSYEIGEEKGHGYSVNLPFLPGTDDEVYLWGFREIVPPLIKAYNPDIVVTALGIDTFRSDPLAQLNLTTNGFMGVIKEIKKVAPRWVATGAGGYDPFNVCRAWTLTWAIILDKDLPDEFPDSFKELLSEFGLSRRGTLYDKPYISPRQHYQICMEEAKRNVEYLKSTVFPIHGI